MVVEQLTPAEELAAERERYRGQWIAVRDNRVIDAASDPAELIARLVEHHETGWVLDRVPEDPDTVFIL